MSSGAVFLGISLLIFWRRAKAIVRKSQKLVLAEPEPEATWKIVASKK